MGCLNNKCTNQSWGQLEVFLHLQVEHNGIAQNVGVLTHSWTICNLTQPLKNATVVTDMTSLVVVGESSCSSTYSLLLFRLSLAWLTLTSLSIWYWFDWLILHKLTVRSCIAERNSWEPVGLSVLLLGKNVDLCFENLNYLQNIGCSLCNKKQSVTEEWNRHMASWYTWNRK